MDFGGRGSSNSFRGFRSLERDFQKGFPSSQVGGGSQKLMSKGVFRVHDKSPIEKEFFRSIIHLFLLQLTLPRRNLVGMRTLALFILLFASSVSADFRERYKNGQFAEALSELEQSPEAASKAYTYYLNRGLIHHALNQDALAVAYLSKAKVVGTKKERAEIEEPLAESTAGLVKWLGVSRLDATSYAFETAGEFLPLDGLFLGFGIFSILLWLGYFLFAKRRGPLMKAGLVTLGCAAFFGGWSAWNDQHPTLILTESRLVKSGPGETFLDRGAVEPGMKLRIVGVIPEPANPTLRWWKVRFNDRHDLGYLPEQSGLLLTDESNTPGI